MNYTNLSSRELDIKNYLQTFKRFPITLDHGKGSYVWDIEGNKYLDAIGGIAVNSIGYSHPKLLKAIKDQSCNLIHISNLFLSIPQVNLSKKLVEISGLSRVFLTNSGVESVEGAIKIARKYAHSIGRGGEIISFDGAFHGRTLATIATGKKQFQIGFEPIPQGFKQVKLNDIDKVKRMISGNTAAIIIEPIQGEGGIIESNDEFLKELRALCDAHNIVLIFDEIQCGIGRTGKMFAKEYAGVEPDIMTLAKGLGGGLPIGAILSNEKVSSAIEFGDHGTTFGGNPLVCSASLATLEVIETENLVQEAKEKGIWFKDQIRALRDERIIGVRGKGLMLGIEFSIKIDIIVNKMFEKGVLVNSTAGNILRILPPLNISYKEMKFIIDVMVLSLQEI